MNSTGGWREGLVALPRHVQDVFARRQDEAPVSVLGDLFHQLDEPLVLVFLELVQRRLPQEVVEVENLLRLRILDGLELRKVMRDAVRRESMPVDQVGEQHLGERRLPDAGDAGHDAEVRFLQDGLRPLEARVRHIAAQPLTDALEVPVGLGEDAFLEDPLKHRGAREPQLEMLALDIAVLRQEIIDVLASENVRRFKAVRSKTLEQYFLTRGRQAHGGRQNVPGRLERLELPALLAGKYAGECIVARLRIVLALHDQVHAARPVPEIDAGIAAHREALERHAERLLQQVPAEQLEVMRRQRPEIVVCHRCPQRSSRSPSRRARTSSQDGYGPRHNWRHCASYSAPSARPSSGDGNNASLAAKVIPSGAK